MMAWRADNPVAPPPMMQISMLSSLTVPSSRELAWQSSGVMCMGRAQLDRQSWRPQEMASRASQRGGKRQFYPC